MDSTLYPENDTNYRCSTDENFAHYTLSYRSVNDSAFNEYARNCSPVIGGVLGTIDGTKLDNGDYIIQLVVFDRSGAVTTDEVQVRIDGQLKIGLFSLVFNDMSIRLPGMDLSWPELQFRITI